jgi:predicted ATP-grasp superfamily ATP-dependent carboligase
VVSRRPSHALSVLVATCSTADDRKTLAAVHALGRAGHVVAVGGDRFLGAPFRSRYCARRVRYPDPARGFAAFSEGLLDAVRQGGFDVLLPLDDYSTFAAAGRRPDFEPHVRLAVPEADALADAHDKRSAHDLARRVGVGTPATRFPATLEEALVDAAALGFPCVMKPRRGAGGFGVRIVECADELREHWAIGSPRGSPAAVDPVHDSRRPFLQEFVPGDVHDVCLLFVRGEPRVAMTQRRIRMWPQRGGIGIENETTDEPGLREPAIALLRALGWHGPASVEFKIDRRDGRPRLLDINGRFWGTLELAIQAGIDFPGLVCRVAVDGDVEPVIAYEVGVRMRWRPPRPRA